MSGEKLTRQCLRAEIYKLEIRIVEAEDPTVKSYLQKLVDGYQKELADMQGPRSPEEFARLRERLSNQRRALRELNRKIYHQQLYAEARMREIVAGESPRTAMEHHHHAKQLELKLAEANARIAALLADGERERGKRDASSEALLEAWRLAEKLGDADPQHNWSSEECDMLGELRQHLHDVTGTKAGEQKAKAAE